MMEFYLNKNKDEIDISKDIKLMQSNPFIQTHLNVILKRDFTNK